MNKKNYGETHIREKMGKRESKEKGGEETQVKRKKRNKW